MKLRLLASALVIAGLSAGAAAQTSIEKMKQMRVATTDLNIPTVPQTGENATRSRTI